MSLLLDARQRAMLAEMGIKVWLPEHASPVVVPAPTEAASASVSPAAADGAVVQPSALPPPLPQTPLDALTQAVAAEIGASEAVLLDAPASQVAVVINSPEGAGQSKAEDFTYAQEIRVLSKELEKNGGIQYIPEVKKQPIAPRIVMPMALVSGPVADMGWPELREAVTGCRACGLCESRTQTVFGVGAQRADWMVVGEAPGEQEDLRGEPFVGPAGQLLDAMLHAVGLNRQATEGEQAVFIANVLKCRPPANRNPAPAEIAQCQPYLRRQVALVQPKIILAMGRFAVQALLGSTEPIGRLRQQVHSYEGVPVIVSYHPAYLLRNLPEKAKAWADLVLAMQVARQGVGTEPPQP